MTFLLAFIVYFFFRLTKAETGGEATGYPRCQCLRRFSLREATWNSSTPPVWDANASQDAQPEVTGSNVPTPPPDVGCLSIRPS